MPVFSRKTGEWVKIGDRIKITLLATRPGKAKLRVEAPPIQPNEVFEMTVGAIFPVVPYNVSLEILQIATNRISLNIVAPISMLILRGENVGKPKPPTKH